MQRRERGKGRRERGEGRINRVCGKKFFLGAGCGVSGLTHFQVVNYLGFAAKSFSWGQGVGCGVWGFTSFEVTNYLIFREKVPEFSP